MAVAFAEDRAGNLWVGFGTDALARFSGGRFTLFTSEQGLPAGEIYDLYLDHAGRLWIASTTGGSGFDFPGTDQFTPVLPDHPVKPGDTWTKSFDQTLPFGGGDLSYTSHNTFVRYEKVSGVKAAVIRSTMSVPLDLTIDLRKLLDTYGQGAPIPKGSHPTIQYGGRVSMDQTAWFDPIGGSLVKTLLVAQFDMQMQFKGFPSKQLPGGGQVAFAGSMTLTLTRQS